MPHIHIEYSQNLESVIDMTALVEMLRQEACQLESFPMPGIRVRATAVDHYAIADGQPKHGFIDMSVRLREGRTEDVKKAAINHLFETLKTFMAPVMATHSVALSSEIRDINANLSPKFGTIRDHLEKNDDSA